MAYDQWDIDRAQSKAKGYEAAGETGKALEAVKWANYLRDTINKGPAAKLAETAGNATGIKSSGAAPLLGYNTAPSYSIMPFQAPSTQAMSYEDALARSRAQLEPLRAQSRTSAGAVSQQQQSLLRQTQGARGELRSGGTVQGSINLSNALQKALADIDTGYNTQAAQAAQGIQERDAASKGQAFRDALAAWQAQNSIGLQAAGLTQADRLARMPYESLTKGQEAELDLGRDRLAQEAESARLPYESLTKAQEVESDLSQDDKRYQWATDEVTTFGKVVTQETADILGVPIGTPSWKALDAIDERTAREKEQRANQNVLTQIKNEAAGRYREGTATPEDLKLLGLGESSLSDSEERDHNKGLIYQAAKRRLDDFWTGAGPQGPTREEALEIIKNLELDMQADPARIKSGVTKEDLVDIVKILLRSAGIPSEEYSFEDYDSRKP